MIMPYKDRIKQNATTTGQYPGQSESIYLYVNTNRNQNPNPYPCELMD